MSPSTRLLALFSLLLAAPGLSLALRVDFDDYEPLPMYLSHNLTVRVSFDESSNEELLFQPYQQVVLTFRLTDNTSWAIDVLSPMLVFNYDQIKARSAQDLELRANIVGVNTLEVFGHLVDARRADEDFPPLPLNGPEIDPAVALKIVSDGEPEKGGLDLGHLSLGADERTFLRSIYLRVVIKDRFLNQLFTLIMTAMIMINTVNMGAQLNFEIIKAVFKKPIGPGVGFFSQFLLMPLFSFGVGWLMANDNMLFRLGLFVLGCCPGGTGSNFWCIILGGDINLSITMTFVSTIAALGMMPVWLSVLGPVLTEGTLVIPYRQLFTTLIMLIAPISLGLFIQYKWPKFAKKVLGKIIIPFTLLTLLFIFTVGVYINFFIFQLMTWKMVAAGFMVTGSGYICGALLAYLFRLTRPQIIAVSIETAIQNGSIAFILLKVSLTEPLAEMASVASVAQLVLTGIPLWCILFIYKSYQKCCKNDAQVDPLQQGAAAEAESLAEADGAKAEAQLEERERLKPSEDPIFKPAQEGAGHWTPLYKQGKMSTESERPKPLFTQKQLSVESDIC